MAAEPGPPLSILLIDPRAGASAVVRTMLEASGHRVTFVHDWATAELRLTLQPYEAVVMSVVTPGTRRKSAAALLRACSGRNGALPLLGLATGADHLAREKALAEGFDAVLVQPYAAEVLEAALRQVVLDREPPLLLDAERRTALRGRHGPSALAALDEVPMALAARLLPPIIEQGAAAEEILAAAEALAEALEAVGAVHATAMAREMASGAAQGRRAAYPMAAALTATRGALRHDRLTAARRDPIWAASDTSPGDTP